VAEGWLCGFDDGPGQDILVEPKLAAVDDAKRLLDRANQIFADLVPKFTSEWLGTPRTIRSRFGCDHAPPWIVLRHIVNHSTYHRGQFASKLKRSELEPPSTDFIDWSLAQLTQIECGDRGQFFGIKLLGLKETWV
jgi:uncharacterized damage-inducible protein DinB